MTVRANDRGDPTPDTASMFMPGFGAVGLLFVSTVGVVRVRVRVAGAPLVRRMLLAMLTMLASACHDLNNTCMGAHR